MKTHSISIPLTCSALLLSPLLVDAASKKSGETSAPIELSADSADQVLTWKINTDWHTATLKLTGNGIEDFAIQYTAGEDITLEVLGADDISLPDGTYHWTLVVNQEAPTTRVDETEQPTSEALKQAGSLTITNAGFLLPEDNTTGGDQDSSNLTKAAVTASDAVIKGSLAVGIDSSSSESFGFDTIRLKENNLRIHFDDTSGSASFPKTDWRITINDSSNGGLEHFSIDDATNGKTPFRILATAPTASLHVHSNGNVGFGTASPAVDTHVVSGNSPTLRLEQDGSNGFSAQTWDIASNETNFFIRDVSNGSKLPFRIKPGAPDNSIFIHNNGNVGLGTATPDVALDIETATPMVRLTDTSASQSWDVIGGANFYIRDNTNASTVPVTVEAGAPANSLYVDASGQLGLGTDLPSAALDVVGNTEINGSLTASSDTTALTVTNTSATAADRTTLSLTNKGANTIFLNNTNTGAVGWTVTATDAGELDFQSNGALPGSIMSVDQYGQFTAMTSVSAPTINQTSDVNVKEDIKPINGKDILRRVSEMPISEWTFKFDETNARHIGPMAQDFKAQFDLGNSDKTIGIGDSAGVALAAIKGLNQVIEEKDVEINALKQRSEGMQQQIDLLIKEVSAIKSKN